MLHFDRVTFTTDASGDDTVYSRPFVGLLHAVRYEYIDGDTGADFTITDEATGIALLTVTNAGTASLTIMPRGATVGTTNAASLYAGAGTAVEDRLPVCGRIKTVVAQGGNAKTGALVFVWDE